MRLETYTGWDRFGAGRDTLAAVADVVVVAAAGYQQLVNALASQQRSLTIRSLPSYRGMILPTALGRGTSHLHSSSRRACGADMFAAAYVRRCLMARRTFDAYLVAHETLVRCRTRCPGLEVAVRALAPVQGGEVKEDGTEFPFTVLVFLGDLADEKELL